MDYDHRKWPGVILRPLKRHHLKPFAAGSQCAKKGEPQAISVGQGGEMLQEMLEESNRKEVSRPGLGLGAL